MGIGVGKYITINNDAITNYNELSIKKSPEKLLVTTYLLNKLLREVNTETCNTLLQMGVL